MLTPEQIAAGAARITMRFSDGKCVYFRMAKSVIETGDILFAVYTFGNFGTTTPPIPPEADLIFAGNSANGTNPDFGGTTGGGGGYTPGDPPPHDPDNGNNNNNNHEDKDNDKDGDGIDDSQQTETVKRVWYTKATTSITT